MNPIAKRWSVAMLSVATLSILAPPTDAQEPGAPAAPVVEEAIGADPTAVPDAGAPAAEAPTSQPAELPQPDAASTEAAVADEPAPAGEEAAQPSDTSPSDDEPAPIEATDEPAAAEAESTDESEAVAGESDEAPDEEAADDAASDEEAATPIDWEGLIDRAPEFLALTHHAAVHMPIALWLFGALFVVIGAVIPSLRNQVPAACLIGGALTSVAATASGWWYADFEYGMPWDWEVGLREIDWSEQLTQHRWLGVTLMFASCVLSIVAIVSLARRSFRLGVFWRLGLLALAAAVAWEGHIGGELIHGEGFLEEAYQEWVNPDADDMEE